MAVMKNFLSILQEGLKIAPGWEKRLIDF